MRLTKKEYAAVNGLLSYYCSLDYIENTKEAKEASDDEQIILRGLDKLLKIYRKLLTQTVKSQEKKQ